MLCGAQGRQRQLPPAPLARLEALEGIVLAAADARARLAALEESGDKGATAALQLPLSAAARTCSSSPLVLHSITSSRSS
mgnify:CR=1 FL=1